MCAKHFPPDFPVIKVKGKERPQHPPIIFSGIPKSLIPTPPPPKRRTLKAESSARLVKEDELSNFLEEDKINSYNDLVAVIQERIGKKWFNIGTCFFFYKHNVYKHTET